MVIIAVALGTAVVAVVSLVVCTLLLRRRKGREHPGDLSGHHDVMEAARPDTELFHASMYAALVRLT